MHALALISLLALSAAPPPPTPAMPTAPGMPGGMNLPKELPKPPPGTRFAAGGNLTFEVPIAWDQKVTVSSMRRGQWALPIAKGDKTAPEAVLFYFGEGSGGSVDDNITRWVQGFDVGAGKNPKDAAKITTTERAADKLRITRVELKGRYVAPKMPGSPEKWDEPNWQLLAAVVESPEGPHFLRVVGPAKSVSAQTKVFDALLASLKLQKPESKDAVPK